jgi:acyl-CoA thioester hydrolase
MGIVYYGNYAQYYEIGRVETMRSLGVSYQKLETEKGVMLPVVHMECKFHKPAKYDESLTIRTRLESMPDKLICFHTDIINSEGETVNRGVVKLFFVDMKSGKRISAPIELKEKLKPFFEKE